MLRKGYIGISAYLVATAISLIYPLLSFFVCLALVIYYVFGVKAEVVAAEDDQQH